MKSRIMRRNWLSLMLLFCFCTTLVVAEEGNTAGLFNNWQTVGPDGGDAREIVIDPNDKNRLYISTIDGQIYTSADAGKNWALLVNFNRPQLVLDQLMIDPRDSKIIYTSGHRHKEPGGFFKTTDGGRTWKEAKDLKNESVHAMVQSTLDPNVIIAGTVNGIFISKDAGDDWEKVTSPSAPVNIDSLAIDPRDVNTIYAGTWWRAYKTTDGGKNWRLIKDGMIDDSDVFAIDIDPRNPDNVFASACSGIYFSANKGEKWSKVQGIPSQSRRTRDILQHPSLAGAVYAGTTEGFWMTTNNGKSWSLTTSRQLEVNSIAIHPDEPQKIYIATNNYGVMVSGDGGKTFSMTNGNLSTRLTYSITPDVERPNRLYATTINTATGGGFVFVSDDEGRSWQPATRNITVNRLIPYSLLQDAKNPNTIYLGTNLGLYRSIDRGASWAQVTAPKPAPAKRAAPRRRTAARTKAKPAPVKTTAPVETAANTAVKVPALTDKINVMIRAEDGKNSIFAGTNKGLFRSSDPMTGWEKVPFGQGIDEQVFAVHISNQNPSTIWVGTATSGVIVSRDGGATWQKNEGVPVNVPISSIAVDPQRPEVVYVGTKQTFFVTRDGGKSWQRRGGNLPLGNYNSILINPRDTDEIFVASALENNGGIYQSNDAGASWKRIDQRVDLPSHRVWTLAFSAGDPNRIFAGTHSAGIYRIERAPAASENITRPRVSQNGN